MMTCPRIHKHNYESADYRVATIILDTAQCRLFRPVCSDLLNTDAKTHFIELNFVSKGIEEVNLPSVLRSKSIIETVSTLRKRTTNNFIHLHKTIASKISSFYKPLSGLDYHQFHNNPSQCFVTS